MNIQTIIASFLRHIRGENPAKTVVRKNERMNRVIHAETAAINTVIETEISGARTLAAVALRRIETIAATGMLTPAQRRDADSIRSFLGKTVAA